MLQDLKRFETTYARDFCKKPLPHNKEGSRKGKKQLQRKLSFSGPVQSTSISNKQYTELANSANFKLPDNDQIGVSSKPVFWNNPIPSYQNTEDENDLCQGCLACSNSKSYSCLDLLDIPRQRDNTLAPLIRPLPNNNEYIHHINPAEHRSRYSNHTQCIDKIEEKRRRSRYRDTDTGPCVENRSRTRRKEVRMGPTTQDWRETGARMGPTTPDWRETRASMGPSTQEWREAFQLQCQSAEECRNQSEQVRSEVDKLILESEASVSAAQNKTQQLLEQRIRDIDRQKSMVQTELEDHINQDKSLDDIQDWLSSLQSKIDKTLDVSIQNRLDRGLRRCQDRAEDHVEHRLRMEEDDLKYYSQQINQMINQIDKQRDECLSARHRLEHDLSNKIEAINVDLSAREKNNQSKDIHLHEGIEHVPQDCPVEIWHATSNQNIQNSAAMRGCCLRLVSSAKEMAEKAIGQLRASWEETNRAIEDRIQQTREARIGLQTQIASINMEIDLQNGLIHQLETSFCSLDDPLKVATTRLAMRAGRHNVELCRDNAHLALVKEVATINQSRFLLRNKMNEAQKALQDLVITKSRLEHAERVKAHSLEIDKTKCLKTRRNPFDKL